MAERGHHQEEVYRHSFSLDPRVRSCTMSQRVLQAYIESETQAILQDCTTCGKCVDVCPMLPYGNLQGADSKHVVSGILDILRGGQGHDEARRWAQVCTASGSCIPACPEGINPRKMLNIAKHTLKSRERLEQSPRDTYFKRMAQSIRLLVGTQMMPEQYRRFTGLSPAMKSRAEVIFYLGCNVLRTPHIVFNVMDILEAMEVDYEVLGGVNNCCGIVHFRTQGNLDGSDRIESHTLRRFAEFRPQHVLTWCPSCQLHLGETTAGATALPYALEHITQFLVNRLDDLRRRFVKSIPKRVALHEHNGIAGTNDNVRALLHAIPGIELVEIAQLAEPGYTCGGGSLGLVPLAQQDVHQHLLESAKAAGVELLVLVYHGCHRVLCDAQGRYPFEVKNFTSVVAEALGLEPHEDLFQRYKLHQDVGKIIADAEPFIRAHDMDPAAVAAALTDPALWV
jgi:heterodisulfide reductase subunit D